jgi:hypothetical protein
MMLLGGTGFPIAFPAGVLSASWEARTTWELYHTSRTGRQSTATLKVPGVASLPAGSDVNGAGQVTVTGSGVTLEDWDFRNFFVVVRNNDCVLRNCVFDNQRGVFYLVNFGSGAGDGPFSGGLIENCTFDCEGTSGPLAAYVTVNNNFSGIELRRSRLLRAQADSIQIAGDDCLLQDLYITAGGFADGSHCDAITVSRGDNCQIRRILVDHTPVVAAQLGTITNAVRAQPTTDNDVTNLSVSNIIVSGYESLDSYPLHFADGAGGEIVDASVTDNLWGLNQNSAWFHPSTEGVVTSTGNQDLATGDALSEIV